jgi:hypothetical protein
VISVVTYGAASGWAAAWLAGTALAGNAVAIGMIAGAIAGFAGGAVATGTLKGGLQGAFSGMVFGGIGGYFGDGFSWGKVVASGFAGGITESLQGGNFGDGFLAAGITAAAMPQLGKGGRVARSIKSALLSGSVSALTGGKFANGALSGAIQGAMTGADTETTASGSGSGPGDPAIPPDKVEESSVCYVSADAAMAGAARQYGPTGVTNRQELEVGLVPHLSGTYAEYWTFLTPGWGPVGSRYVNFHPVLQKYKDAGFSPTRWGHGHWDGQLNFSATDMAFVQYNESQPTYMVNKNMEVRVLTRADYESVLKTLPIFDRTLHGVQKAVGDDGYPGTVVGSAR